LQHVDAVNATTGKEGWLTLNVSEALEHWMNKPDENRGLYLSVHPAERSGKLTRSSSLFAFYCRFKESYGMLTKV
jgi:bone morphogenetic protein 7